MAGEDRLPIGRERTLPLSPGKKTMGEFPLQFERSISYHLGHLHETASSALGLMNKGIKSFNACCK